MVISLGRITATKSFAYGVLGGGTGVRKPLASAGTSTKVCRSDGSDRVGEFAGFR